MVHNTGNGAGNTSGWQDDITPGSSQLAYIEDCIGQLFNYTGQSNKGSTALVQNYYGARMCVRATQLNFCHVDCHGTAGAVGCRWWEIYGNSMYLPSGITGNQVIYQIRAGSGVAFNTLVNGPGTSLGDLTAVYLLTDENPPYNSTNPPYGPGAGIFVSGATQGPTSSPAYIWGLGSGVVASSTSPITVNQNYFASSNQPSSMTISEKASQVPATTYSYAPYTYPHPLTGLSTAPGDGLTAATDLSLTYYIVGATTGSYTPPGNNYIACYSSQFTNGIKAGATEWSTLSNTTYARQAMGANGTGWTIGAYVNGTGVAWTNTNLIYFPKVASNAQTLYSVAGCDALIAGTGNVNFFCDLPNSGQLSVPIGINVVLPASTGLAFLTY